MKGIYSSLLNTLGWTQTGDMVKRAWISGSSIFCYNCFEVIEFTAQFHDASLV